jgi:hypothetical protein
MGFCSNLTGHSKKEHRVGLRGKELNVNSFIRLTKKVEVLGGGLTINSAFNMRKAQLKFGSFELS